MALTATIHTFEIDLADSDRGVYESLEIRAVRHPSESAEHLVTRVLAYCLELSGGDGTGILLAGRTQPGPLGGAIDSL